jgi:hypothetical protein
MSGLDGLWWAALLIQLAALPGTLLPVLPGLALLPLGAGLWLWAVGWNAGWPAFALACLMLLLGWGAEALGLVLGPARLQASRWDSCLPCPWADRCWGPSWGPCWGQAWGSWSVVSGRRVLPGQRGPVPCPVCVAPCWWAWRWWPGCW